MAGGRNEVFSRGGLARGPQFYPVEGAVDADADEGVFPMA